MVPMTVSSVRIFSPPAMAGLVRTCSGHPRLSVTTKTWMPGRTPGMTKYLTRGSQIRAGELLLRPQRRAEAGIRAAIRRRFAAGGDLGEQHDERGAIHRHFVVGIDHAGVTPARAEHLVDDVRGAVEHLGLVPKARRAT